MLAWAWATLGALVLGVSGHLARGPLLAWAAAGMALAGVVRLRMSEPPDCPSPPGGPIDGAATLAIALAMWTFASVGFPGWLIPERALSDAPIYHLYFAAQWWKSGRLSIVPAPFGDVAVSYFPAGGEVLFAALMAIFDGDLLARTCPFFFLVLAAASVFAIARRLGVGTAAAIIATVLFVMPAPMFIYSFMANVDAPFVAGYLAAAHFFLEYARRRETARGTLAARRDHAAGGCWSTKPTGTVFVPPLLAVAAIAVVARGGPWRVRLGHLLLLATAPGLMAGYWFARNACDDRQPTLSAPGLGSGMGLAAGLVRVLGDAEEHVLLPARRPPRPGRRRDGRCSTRG